jgi:hypothetical protein
MHSIMAKERWVKVTFSGFAPHSVGSAAGMGGPVVPLQMPSADQQY